MKIVMLEGCAVNPGDLSWDGYRALGEVIVYPRTRPEDIIPRIGDAEIVLVNKCPITREVLLACPNLRYVGVQATGYNVVDIAAACEFGVTVTNIPAYSTPSVAQHTFALLLALTNHVGAHNEAVHQGAWIKAPDFCFWNTSLTELCGKTMGIVGFGQIGQKVAEIARAFGMNVVACGPHRRDDCMIPQEDLLRIADIITLHCPLTPENTHMINRETLAQMKPGALLINTARGGLVDEQAVTDALVSGHLGGFAADVVTVEPMSPDCPLLTAPRCILTPHLAWAPLETRSRLIDISLANLRAWMDGHPQNTVT